MRPSTMAVFMPPSKAQQTLLPAEIPPAFRSRLNFTMPEPLERARFPAGVQPVRLLWDDRIRNEDASGAAGTNWTAAPENQKTGP